jgi:hypothetical protein
MRYREILTEAPVPAIAKGEAIDRQFFGPVYHGSVAGRDVIDREGFKVAIDAYDRANGYPMSDYASGLPPPIHHLGFGVYFTTALAIAKRFNGNTTKGLHEYYLNVPRVETINFGATNTMMRWWIANGYDFAWPGRRDYSDPAAAQERMRATHHLTERLQAKYDAVWYKGKGLHRLLDGDQICVFDPTCIYRIDPKLAIGLQVGAKVTHNQTIPYADSYIQQYNLVIRHEGDWTVIERSLGTWEDGSERRPFVLHSIPSPKLAGIIIGKRAGGGDPTKTGRASGDRYDVKWAKGGLKLDYLASELTPVNRG